MCWDRNLVLWKKNLPGRGQVFTSKYVGTGPSSYEKRIHRAAVRYLRVNMLGPDPRLVDKEFTGPRSQKDWETLVYATDLVTQSTRVLIHTHTQWRGLAYVTAPTKTPDWRSILYFAGPIAKCSLHFVRDSPANYIMQNNTPLVALSVST